LILFIFHLFISRLHSVHIPLTLNSVVLVFNVPGVKSTVNLTPVLLAQIFQGNITQWNHPDIVGKKKTNKQTNKQTKQIQN